MNGKNRGGVLQRSGVTRHYDMGSALSMGMRLISALKALFRRCTCNVRLIASPKEKRQLALIDESGLFDRSRYLAQLSWVARLIAWSPMLHYLRVGFRQGIQPSTRFNSEWYLKQHPDVATAGENPLLHFLECGVHEGRRSSPNIYLSDLPVFHGTPAYLNEQLWQGYARLALPRLNAMARAGDGAAQWYLASWHYANGRYERALSLLEEASGGANSPFFSRIPLARYKCLIRLGLDEIVQDEFENGSLELSHLQACLVEASLVGKPLRVDALNKLFHDKKLAAVGLRNPNSPLTLANLTSVPVSPRRRATTPGVSIVVPAFNAEDTLAIALGSLLAQSWRNLEIIVVDDASTDGTADVTLAMAQKDSRIRLVRHDVNRGAYAARNTGVDAAQLEYVTTHDSDDWSHPQKIELQVAALLENPDRAGAITDWARVDSMLRFTGAWHLDDGLIMRNYSSLMVRRSMLEEVGAWDAVRVAADAEFICRIERHFGCDSIIDVLPGVPLALSLVHPNSLTQRSETHVRSVFHGLRNLYHQAASWWHRRQLFPVVEPGCSQRFFPAPLGNWFEMPCCFDVVAVADLSHCNLELKRVMEALLELRVDECSVALVHWPDPDNFASQQVADEIWELCHAESLAVAHAGVSLQCQDLVVHGQLDLLQAPDRVPELQVKGGVRTLETAQPMPADSAEVLLAYFAAGGYNLDAL